MNRYSTWRYLLLAVLTILAIVYALPNIYGEDPAIQISHQTMTTSAARFNPTEVEKKVRKALYTEGMRAFRTHVQDHAVQIAFKNTEDQMKAEDTAQSILGADYSVAASLAPRTPSWLRALGAHPMKLGLDLRGGIHFLLDVKAEDLIKTQKKDDMRRMSMVLRKGELPYKTMYFSSTKERTIVLQFDTMMNRNQAMVLLKRDFSQYDFSFSGLAIHANLSNAAVKNITRESLEQVTAILNKRINELGVAEPVIQQQGTHYISLDLPGIQDSAHAKAIIDKMATVRFQLVDTEHNAKAVAKTGVIPAGLQLLYTDTGEPVLLKDSIVLSGKSITHASSIISQYGQPAVQIRISGPEVSRFNRITAKNINRPLAVVYVETKTLSHKQGQAVILKHQKTEQVISVATINSALGRNFEISHLGNLGYAKQLALLLRSGAYAVPVDYVQERLVGPSLGKENIHMGILSTIIGSCLVIAFMLIYYRVFGLIADLALLLNIIFIMAILSIMGATLTLPGIAGIVLTVGMAVDANVLINERIREELRNGVSPQASIKSGYDRAFTTIVDANLTTLIVMIVLFALGSGPVQGFAITTTIGLLSSMITAIFFTRAVVNVCYGYRSVPHLSIGIRPIEAIKKRRGI